MVTLKIRFEIIQIILALIDPAKVRIIHFGSHVRGEEDNYSDIDIGLESTTHDDLDRMIQTLRSKFQESNIPYKIDIINLDRAKNDFKEIALRKHEIWHQPQ